MTQGELRLRIVVESPLANTALAIQRGRDTLLFPTPIGGSSASFEFVVRLGSPRTGSTLRFLGEFAQGPASDRFVYVNSGTRAGQADSCWDRRAKVPLGTITPAQVRRVLANPDLILEARIAGIGRDGGPMCASVPLLGGGWAVKRATQQRAPPDGPR